MTFQCVPYLRIYSSSNSTVEGNSSSKTTGHMTGKLLFNQPYVKKINFLNITLFFFGFLVIFLI